MDGVNMIQDSEFTGKVVLVTGASQGHWFRDLQAICGIGRNRDHGARNLEKLEAARDSIPNNI
jgi:NADP-dependent 3-hydroxy acid dehydrogenase YdfG